MSNIECYNIIKTIYNNIFKIDSNFELIFMTYMLYVNFKYEDIFSDPSILELMARNTHIIDEQLKLNPKLTRRQLESMYLTLNVFLYMTLVSINFDDNGINGEINGVTNGVNGEINGVTNGEINGVTNIDDVD
jgi:hypothetical protein